MTLLHYLAWSSKTARETFQRYHKRSSLDLRTVDEEGRSMLHFAAQRGNRAIIEYVFYAATSLDVNGKDCRGMTALHYAVESKRACETIGLLMSWGADILAMDHQGRSALYRAAELSKLSMARSLVPRPSASKLGRVDISSPTPMQVAEHQKAKNLLTSLAQARELWDCGKQLKGMSLDQNCQVVDSVNGVNGSLLATRHTQSTLLEMSRCRSLIMTGCLALLGVFPCHNSWLRSSSFRYGSFVTVFAVAVYLSTLLIEYYLAIEIWA